MADHLSDEEQLQQLKNWWKDNGASLVIAVFLGLTAYFGFQWWQNHQQQQAEQASALYSELTSTVATPYGEALAEEKLNTAAYLAQQLKDDYAETLYAASGSLLMAKLAVNNNDLASAVESLLWVVEQGHESFSPLAKLRLARVYFAQENYDDALSLMDVNEENAYLSLNAELQGDILAAQGNTEEAQVAYQLAINTLDDASSFRKVLLPIKLADLPSGEKQ